MDRHDQANFACIWKALQPVTSTQVFLVSLRIVPMSKLPLPASQAALPIQICLNYYPCFEVKVNQIHFSNFGI
jgi:hypothetical protein